MQIDGILFDFGGTLDGDGLHWLDRFCALYPRLGFSFERETIRAAFDFAEAEAARDHAMQTTGLQEMVQRHVRSQFAKLAIDNPEARRALVTEFAENVRRAAHRNASLLQELSQRGLRLGVISNGCGNTAVLCDELGYSPYLATVLDSQRVGLSKPDPQFFSRASQEIGLPPARLLMVGDSLERDIRPAKQIGMRTAWLNPNHDAGEKAADIQISRLAELRDAVLRPVL
ncbi:MAG: HAD family hydrolase [Chthoniobacterales bacterium]